MKKTWMDKRKRNRNWSGSDRAWIKESMLKKCTDQIYRSFTKDTQKKVYAIQKNSGEKKNRDIYNKCFQINMINKFHFEQSLKLGGRDKLKLAHVEAVYYLMQKLLPLVADLDNIEPYNILTMAITRNRSFRDLIERRMDK